jgi:hypothetical protein
MIMDSPPKRLIYSGLGDNNVNQRHDQQSPASPTRVPVTFKCKWRDTQNHFQANPPSSLSGLFALLRQHIPSLASQRNTLQLVEFNRSVCVG